VTSNNQVHGVPNSGSTIRPGQAVTYTSFNAPLSIALGGYSMTLQYGPDNNREQTVLTDSASNVTTRNFATSYENTSVNGGPLTEVNYIQCGGDLVAMDVKQGSYDTMNYVYTDHLGSILAVNNSKTTYYQSFDAWGNYRNPNDGSYSGAPIRPSWLYRGYTGHEELPEFQLINMNGRLYDPLINSMLSPDITVQAPTNTQNFNRYSYCLNNPLKFTDPSGFIVYQTMYMWEVIQENAAKQAALNSWEADLNNGYNANDAPDNSLGPNGGWGNGGGGGGGVGNGAPSPIGNNIEAWSEDPTDNFISSGIYQDIQWNIVKPAGNTGTTANSSILSNPFSSTSSMFGGTAAKNNANQVGAIMGSVTSLPTESDPSAPLTYNGLNFSGAGAIMNNADNPTLYINNAIAFMNQYGHVPFRSKSDGTDMGPPYSDYMDCSATFDRSAGYNQGWHEWTTAGGTPPGMYQVTETLFNNSGNTFSQNADEFLDNANLQYGDFLVWPNHHGEFYAGLTNGNPTLFGEQNSWGLSYYYGYPNFESFWDSWGQPNVYRQNGW
jgi:RHS repeat-associated protein